MNCQLKNDFEDILKSFTFIEELKNATIMVSGGTGLIGSNLLKFLVYADDRFELRLNIIGLARNKEKVQTMGFSNKITWIFADLKEKIHYDGNVDYIFHTASPTQSKFLATHPVETINDTVLGANNLLEFSLSHNCKSFVYLSSIEIYGQNFDDNKVSENDYKYIDNLLPRNCYPISKQLIENLCISYWSEYKVPVKIARLTQTFGAGVSLDDNRVFMQMAKSIINNEDIVLHTSGGSSKSYIYLTDAINALFYILFNGFNGEAYNVANEESYISIKNLANFLIKEFKTTSAVRIELNPNAGYAPETKINLDVEKIKKLGWKPHNNLKQMFEKLINYIKTTKR